MMQKLILFIILSSFFLIPYIHSSSQITANSVYDEELKVDMYQWYFLFTQQNGTVTNDTVTLYTDTAYLFNVTSVDVQHGLVVKGNNFSPLAGKYSTAVITFTSGDIGSSVIQCSHNCGAHHLDMKTTLNVIALPATTSSNTTSATGATVTSTQTTTVTSTQNVTYMDTTTEITTSNVTQIQTSTVTATYVKQLPYTAFTLIFLLIVPVINIRRRRKDDER